MKKIILLLVGFTLFSCSNDEETSSSVPTTEFTEALPLNNGNYWTYDVVGTTTTRDSLYIFGDETIGAHTYKKFKNKDNISTGFYTTSLNNNNLRKSSGKLLLTGSFNVTQGQTLPIDLDLSLVDFIIFKEYANFGEVIDKKTGTIQQTVNGIPLTIEYKLKAIGGKNIGNFTSPNNDTYTDVRSTKIVVNLKVSIIQTVGGISFPFTVLEPQDVIVSTQYLSKNIGVVYTKTLTTYNIAPEAASNLGIPASDSQIQEEFLDTYNLN